MHLIHAHQLQLREFLDEKKKPSYAILSHTWGDGEVSFQDFQKPGVKFMVGYSKIKKCCEQAIRDGFEYVWVDTCCIDKTSSSALTEAINSMYKWYKDSGACYAYLPDVKTKPQTHLTISSRWFLPYRYPFTLPSVHSLYQWYKETMSYSGDGQTVTENQYVLFPKSRWFTRGWTLQELLAPKSVVFYDCDWVEIGTKNTLHQAISSVTGIPREVLVEGKPLNGISVAQRMSWAANRETTRVEDAAYSLLGIFGVNMPTLYGAGQNAFIRLQHEIMRSSDDHTLFAWVIHYGSRRIRVEIPNQDLDRDNDITKQFPQHIVDSNNLHLLTVGLGYIQETRGSGILAVFAASPKDFRLAQGIRRRPATPDQDRQFSYSITNKGLHIWLPLIQVSHLRDTYQAILDCELEDGRGPLCIYLERDSSGQYSRVFVSLIGIAAAVKSGGDRAAGHIPRELYVQEQTELSFLEFRTPLQHQFHFALGIYEVVGVDPPGIWDHNVPPFITCTLQPPVTRDVSCALMVGVKNDPTSQVIIVLGFKTRQHQLVIWCGIYLPSDLSAEHRTLPGCREYHYHRLKEEVINIDRITRSLPSGNISVAINRGPLERGAKSMIQHHRVLVTSSPLTGLSFRAGRRSNLTLESWESKLVNDGTYQRGTYQQEDKSSEDGEEEEDGIEGGDKDDEGNNDEHGGEWGMLPFA